MERHLEALLLPYPPTKHTIMSETNETKRPTSSAEEPPSKRAKSSDWNAAGNVDNQADLVSNKIPLLPRDYKYLLLDIEGCTTAISFVKDVLFPYIVEHCEDYMAKNLSPEQKLEFSNKLLQELTPQHKTSFQERAQQAQGDDVSELVKYCVQNDLKLATLKSFQGNMWKDGYQNGTLKGHVYQDFVPTLDWMKEHSVQVYIYSSGSVQAQKLLFGNSIVGDLNGYFEGHFDITTSGNKKQSSSYGNIAQSLGVDANQIVFCSDAVAELEAASEAGIGKCVMTVRPGNAPLSPEDAAKYPKVFSLLQLCGSGE